MRLLFYITLVIYFTGCAAGTTRYRYVDLSEAQALTNQWAQPAQYTQPAARPVTCYTTQPAKNMFSVQQPIRTVCE
jgi:hypothetical protein